MEILFTSGEVLLYKGGTRQTQNRDNCDQKAKSTQTGVLIPLEQLPDNRDRDHHNNEHRPYRSSGAWAAIGSHGCCFSLYLPCPQRYPYKPANRRGQAKTIQLAVDVASRVNCKVGDGGT